MPRFQSPTASKASPTRREMLIGGAALVLAGCSRAAPITAAHTPRLDDGVLRSGVGDIARRIAPSRLGVGLMNLDSGETWARGGEQRFPMADVFMLPLAAAALSEFDARRLPLDEAVDIRDIDLSPPPSPIADAWPQRTRYTVRELLAAAAAGSDNTAADVLMKRIGGPGAVTAWLEGKGVKEVRVDRYARELLPELSGLSPFRPAWKGEAAWARAVAAVPPQTQLAAVRTYLADPRDTATPRGMLNFVDLMRAGELISPASRRLLREILLVTPMGARRLKAGLPRGSSLVHKTGDLRPVQGLSAATNDIGVATLPDGRRYLMAVFLAASPLADAQRDGAIADVARALVRGVG